MSFELDLWDGFPILNKNFIKNQDILKRMYNILSTFVSIEREYAISLKNIYEDNKNTFLGSGTVSKAMNVFFNFLNDEYELRKEQYSFIEDRLLAAFNSHIIIQRNSFRENLNNYEELDKKFKTTLQQLLYNQENFLQKCKNLSVSIADLEFFKSNENINTNKKLLNSLEEKKKYNLKEVERTKNDYINILNIANKELGEYNKKIKKILKDSEGIFQTPIISMKYALLNFTNNKIKMEQSICQNLQNNCIKVFEEIDFNLDMKEFIKENATKKFPYQKFEFVNYKTSSINIKDLIKEHKNDLFTIDEKYMNKNKIIQNIKNFLSNCEEIKYKPVENIDNTILKNLDTIKKLVDNIWKNKPLEEKEKSQLYNFIKSNDRNNPLYFIKCLNTYRARGNFLIGEEAYNNLIDLFNLIIDQKNLSEDGEIMKNILMFALTFYKISNKNQKEPKIHIQKGIENNPKINKCDIWDTVIKYCLLIQDKKKINESESEKKIRENNLNIIALNTLVSYLCNMKLFNIKDDVYNETKNYFVSVYNLDEKIVNENVDVFMNEYKNSEKINETNSIGGIDDSKLEKMPLNEIKNDNNKNELEKIDNNINNNLNNNEKNTGNLNNNNENKNNELINNDKENDNKKDINNNENNKKLIINEGNDNGKEKEKINIENINENNNIYKEEKKG